MRTRLLAAGIAFVLTASLSAAAENKGPKPDVGDGHAAWFDITTTNLAQSKAFYQGLFGWQFTSVAGYEDLAADITSGGQSIGSLRRAGPATKSWRRYWRA